MKRRSFFKLAGFGAASLLAGSCLASCDTEPAEEPNNQNIYVGIPINFSLETDVLIIGSGIAGLAAAMDPSEAGLRVIIADKLSVIGGESYSANGLIYAINTTLQQDADITIDEDESWKDLLSYLKTHHYDEGVDLDFERVLYTVGSDWVERIILDYGAAFSDPREYKKNGSPQNFLIPKGGLGHMDSFMAPLREKLTAQGVEFHLGMRAVGFILDNTDTPVGVRFYLNQTNEVTDVKAKHIVIATGGFSCNQDWVSQYLPSLAPLASYTAHSAGDGHYLCQEIQGQLKNMELVPAPTSDVPQVDTWGQFAPIVNISPAGNRFAAEDDIGASALACLKEEQGFWWTIFDDQISENGRSQSVSYVSSNFSKRVKGPFDTLDDLADALSVNSSTLKATFEGYDVLVDQKKDTDFKKTLFLKKLSPPYYAVKQFPRRFRSFGGVLTDADARVIDAAGNAIPTVYCCGECASGSLNGLSSHGGYGIIAGQAIVATFDESSDS